MTSLEAIKQRNISDFLYLIYGLIALLAVLLIRIFDGIWIKSMLLAGIILTILGIIYFANRRMSR